MVEEEKKAEAEEPFKLLARVLKRTVASRKT